MYTFSCIRFSSAALLLTVCAVALFAACGGADNGSNGTATPTAQATGDAIDPCTLLTQAEANTILSAQVREPRKLEQAGGNFRACLYQADDAPGKVIQLQVFRQAASKSELEELASEAARALRTEAKPITGVGDGAFYVDGVLFVLKGSTLVNVAVSLGVPPRQNEARILEADKSAAEKVLGRLR